MTLDTVGQWSETAASNTDVGGINIAEGARLNQYNNAMREMMAQIAKALYGGAVSLSEHGVTGDGSTDDAAAVNAATLAARDAGKAVLVDVPAVEYYMTAPINIYDETVFVCDPINPPAQFRFDRCNAIDCADSTDADDGLTSDFRLANLIFIGNDDTATDGADHIGLNCRRTTRYIVDNVDVRGFTTMCAIDGRLSNSGIGFGNAEGIFTNCQFQTNNNNQQVNSTNNYPEYLVEFLAESNGTGGADGVSFYNCRIYGEIEQTDTTAVGDGATTLFPITVIPSNKVLTDAAHLKVEYVSSGGGAQTLLVNGVDYSVADVLTNTPDVDFTGGSGPLGAPAQVQLLSTTGDGVTPNFRLSARPSFGSSASGRAVFASIGGVEQTAGTAYMINDGNGKSYTFTADASTDKLTLSGTGANQLAVGRIVRVATTSALPGGLSAATDYYATEIDTVNKTCKVATTYANAIAGTPTVVNITSAGTGTHTLTVENAIEFSAAPANAAAIVVNDVNLRIQWVDPNAEACVKLTRGVQRCGFFSCLFGGGKTGLDFNHAFRNTAIDCYFQIHEYAVNFDEEAKENQLVGFSARTDSSILFTFANDNATTPSNAFDDFLGEGTTGRNFIYLKTSYTQDDDDAARLRLLSNQLQLDIGPSGGSVRVGVGGNTVILCNGSAARTAIHSTAAATELWRFDDTGLLTPRLTSGTQAIGDSTHLLSNVFTNILTLADGVTAPGTVAGMAQIYVDTADGDLKVKFGDGFVGTISADS